MNVTITGKHIDLGEAFRGRVTASLAAATEKYFPNPLDAHVTVVRDGAGYRVDIAVHAARNLRMESNGTADDANSAADQAVERMAKRLRRHKRRLVRDHHHPSPVDAQPARVYVVDPEPADTDLPAGDQPVIVAEMTSEVLTLTVGEAVMRLDLAEQPTFLFRNAASGQVNVVYRRADGNVGWIDPSLVPPPVVSPPGAAG